jgi:hypothetical protein
MSADHSLQVMSRRPSMLPVAEVSHLVRCAMSFFESDRAAAWRCLNDASNLVGMSPGLWRRSVAAPHLSSLPASGHHQSPPASRPE